MLRFSKILIANRGEIASRIIRTTKQMGIKSLAVCNAIDTKSNYVKEADEAVFVNGNNNIFVNAKELIKIAKEYKADAIHPGYGFISESPEFSKLCKENNIKFIGPSYESMQLMSSKKDAKELAMRCNIPVVPGYNGTDQSTERIVKEVKRIGYPVLLKASFGGGGRGMRIIQNENNLEDMITMCKNEAKMHFGNGSLIVEKYLPRTRHLEVQVFGDKQGNVVHFGERECSLQRHYQKIIEEAPCFYISNEEKKQLYSWATAIAKASHYEGAGTVEFLVDSTNPSKHQFYFMEMNTRLQVEHLVSQCINHQIDLVELQIRIAQGESLAHIGAVSYNPDAPDQIIQSSYIPSIYKCGTNTGKYAMECRVYNEDPENDFLPGEGSIHYQNQLQDTTHCMIENNITIPPSDQHHSVSFDPMLLKVITCGETRSEVMNRMESALRRSTIVGIPTNIQLLVNAMRMDSFQKEGADSQTIKEHASELTQRTIPSIFELSNCIGAYYAKTMNQKAAFATSSNPWSTLSNFCTSGSMQRYEHYSINGKIYECCIATVPSNLNSFTLKMREKDKEWNTPVEIEVISTQENKLTLRLMDKLVENIIYNDSDDAIHTFPVTNTTDFNQVDYTVKKEIVHTNMNKAIKSQSLCDVICPMPSTVSRILVKKGDHVKKGDVLMIIEAMKMEHIITAPQDGIVEMGDIQTKQFFKKGQQLLRVV